jgi:antitoxin component of MazEF toxin-antitoxin module
VTDLARIQRRVSKKQYLKTKRTYEYERLSLDIPKKYHKTIALLLNRDFDVEVKLENDSVILTLTPQKTFRHAENTPHKTQSRTTKTMIQEHHTSDSV